MRYILFLFSLLLANTASAIDCEKMPTCEELGYSTEDDPYCAENGYMYCPLDYSYKKCVNMDCAKLGFTDSDKTSWCGKIVKCKGDKNFTACKALCEVGDVYYADGTCGYAEDYDASSDKIPVGVVYWITDDGRHGKVINLHDLGRESESSAFDPKNPYDTRYEHFFWGYGNYDVPNLTSYNENIVDRLQAYDPDLYDGQGNTDKILKAEKPKCDKPEGTKDYYQYCIPQAAQAAHDFYPPEVQPNNPKVGVGQWYLPALGELMELYGYDNSQITYWLETTGAKGDNKDIINKTLSTLKSKQVNAEIFTNIYWSSSISRQIYSWVLYMNHGYRGNLIKDYDDNSNHVCHIRVSLEF